MRYRLDVVAPSSVEVVRYAGGWLFDRVLAGWEVRVLVDGIEDDRPLRILGTEVLDLESAVQAMTLDPRPNSLAVAAEMFGRDARVRQGVLGALDHGETEVTLWGESWPSELNSSIDSVEHRLSVAARAFKAQALAAADLPSSAIGITETFRTSTLTCARIGADLVPAG